MPTTKQGDLATRDSNGLIPTAQMPLLVSRSDMRAANAITAAPAGAAAEPGGWDTKTTGTYRWRVHPVLYGTVTGAPFAIFIETPAANVIGKTNASGTTATLIAAATELARWTKSGGVAKTFTDTDVTITPTNTIAIATHGWATGWAMTLTSTGTPPAGLSAGTVYYVINVSAGVIKLATTYENAIAGTAIALTDTGTPAATNTLTPKEIVTGDRPPDLEYAVNLSLTAGDWVGVTDTNNNLLVKTDVGGTSVVMRLITWLERTA